MSQPIARKTTYSLELLVAAVIIAILAAIAIPKFTSATLKSKESSLKRELKMLRDCIELFKNDVGGYPVALSDLSSTVTPSKYYNPTTLATASVANGSWKGPYISNIDSDPISNTAFKYTSAKGIVQASGSDPSTASDGSKYDSW